MFGTATGHLSFAPFVPVASLPALHSLSPAAPSLRIWCAIPAMYYYRLTVQLTTADRFYIMWHYVNLLGSCRKCWDASRIKPSCVQELFRSPAGCEVVAMRPMTSAR